MYFTSFFSVLVLLISTATASASPKVNFDVSLFSLANNQLSGGVVCKAAVNYEISDSRREDVRNSLPTLIFKDCLITFNGNSIKATAYVGVGIYNGIGRNGKKEDQKAYEAVLILGDQNYTNWNVTYDLNLKDHQLVWDIPVPKELKVDGTQQWIRIYALFKEEEAN